jgi:TetR/AcrR family transcriptional repressor of nem operon
LYRLVQQARYFGLIGTNRYFPYVCIVPRVKSFNEEEALTKALELFWGKGYEATSLDDLTNQLGIGKGSFYGTFESKKKLFNRALKIYRINALQTIDRTLAEKSNPIEGIRNLLDMHTESLLSDTASKGCFIANCTTDLPEDTFTQEFVTEHNQIMKAKLVKYMKKGSFSQDPNALADIILTQLTGISVLSRIIKDKNRFKESNEHFMSLFES